MPFYELDSFARVIGVATIYLVQKEVVVMVDSAAVDSSGIKTSIDNDMAVVDARRRGWWKAVKGGRDLGKVEETRPDLGER